MTNEEIAAGIQAVVKLIYKALLFRFVEIDHYVAAKNNVVAARQKFRFQIVKVELNEFLELRLHGIFVVGFFEIAKSAGVVHGFHLLLRVKTFLTGAKTCVADVGSKNFEFPRRRNKRFRRRHVERKRIAQIVVSERIADENCDRICFLTAGATGAPDAQRPIAAFLLLFQKLLENGFLQKVKLRPIAEEAGFVDREIFKKKREFRFSFATGEKAIVAIKRIELAGLQTALETVFQEMRAAFVEEHAAFLINESLQKLQFGFGELHRSCSKRAHNVAYCGEAPRIKLVWRRSPLPPRVV